MHQQHQLAALEEATNQQIAQVLQAPLVALITWQPGQTKAKVAAPAIAKRPYSIDEAATIPIYTDLLVQRVLEHQAPLTISSTEFSPETRHWLNGVEIGQVLALTLRTAPDHEPCAIILVADAADRVWDRAAAQMF